MDIRAHNSYIDLWPFPVLPADRLLEHPVALVVASMILAGHRRRRCSSPAQRRPPRDWAACLPAPHSTPLTVTDVQTIIAQGGR